MRHYVAPVGAIVAGLGFFLPYVNSPTLFGVHMSRTGAEIGSFLWIVLIGAVIVLGCSLWMRDNSRSREKHIIILLASGAGISALVYAAFILSKDDSSMFGLSASDVGVEPAVGAWSSLIGLVVALGTALHGLASRPVADGGLEVKEASESGVSNYTKRCPDCAEDIKIEAKVCRFCGRRFSEEEVQTSVLLGQQKSDDGVRGESPSYRKEAKLGTLIAPDHPAKHAAVALFVVAILHTIASLYFLYAFLGQSISDSDMFSGPGAPGELLVTLSGFIHALLSGIAVFAGFKYLRLQSLRWVKLGSIAIIAVVLMVPNPLALGAGVWSLITLRKARTIDRFAQRHQVGV